MAKPIHSVVGKKLKISHWDDEVSLDLEYLGNESTNMYAITDGFEYEVVLDEKPIQNAFKFRLNQKGLDFFYQPALTQEEIDGGVERPENVIGSYAVYHSTKKNHILGQKNYMTGKVCHIYRPKAHDANGVEQWCEMDITGSVLTVTVPQEYLDTAVYPIIVDPTFGYTTAGGTSASFNDDQIYGNRSYTMGEDGTLDSMSMYTDADTGTNAWSMAIYKNADDTFVGKTQEGNDTTAGWNTLNANGTVNLVDTTVYWLGWWIETGIAGFYYYDTDASYEIPRNIDTYDYNWPASIASWSSNPLNTSRRVSIYATYTATGGPTYTLTAAQGSLTLTGQTTNLKASRKLTAEQGSYTLTGQDVILTYTPDSGPTYTLVCVQGSYTLSGQDTRLAREYTLVASQGSYVLTGQNTALQVARKLTAEQGSYTLTGQDTNLARGYTLVASQGSYTLSGQASLFKVSRKLLAELGSYTLSGQNVIFDYSNKPPSKIRIDVINGKLYYAITDSYIIPL